MKSASQKPRLGSPKNAQELLDMYFLDMRAGLLETAAAWDRIERAEGGEKIISDPRLQALGQACGILKDSTGNRAEQFLKLFSKE